MRSVERKKKYGEVFTPLELVNEILDWFDEDIWKDPDRQWIDSSCGSGNILVQIKNRLMQFHNEEHIIENMIYGVDLLQDNVDECILRLNAQNYKHNIVCADALRYHYRFDGSGPYDKEEIFDNIFELPEKSNS